MADFYALGELLIDFTPAGKTPAGIPIFEQNPGGAPANVAVQAARLGVSAGFIGKVGQDMFGTFLRDTLVKQNVDVENLHFSNDTATSLAFVQLSEPNTTLLLSLQACQPLHFLPPLNVP